MTRYRPIVFFSLAVATLCVGSCSPTDLLFGHRAAAPTSTDARFAPFDEPTANGLDLDIIDTAQSAGATDSMKARLPKLPFEDAKYTGAYRINPRDPLGELGSSYWLHAIVTTDSQTIGSLLELDEDPSTLLPGIHPDLHSFVPKDCTFTRVNHVVATNELTSSNDGMFFGLEEIAVSKDCSMIILRGTGE